MHRFDHQHPPLGRLPALPQPGLKGQPLVIHDVVQPLAPLIELAVAVARRVIQAVIHQPELIQARIDGDASHHPDSWDPGLGVTPGLAPNPLDSQRGVLVQYGVLKHEGALGGRHPLAAHVLPDQPRGDPLPSQGAIDGLMAELFAVIREVR